MAAGQPRRLIAARAVTTAIVAVAALAGSPAPASALVDLWAITASPLTLEVGKDATVQFTVTNLGVVTDTLGCVEVSIPGAFDLKEAKVVEQPSGKHWKGNMSGASGSTQVAEYRAEHDADELVGGETAVFKVKVKAAAAGVFTWTARAWSTRSCDGGSFLAVPLAIVVGPDVTPITTPTPTPVPTPEPTPRATPTPTPKPTPTPTPRATPTPTPTPILGLPLPLPSLGIAKPTPTPVPSPRPSSTPTSAASPGESPAPTPVESGAPSPTPAGRDDPSKTAVGAVDPGGGAPGSGPADRLRIGRETDGAEAAGPQIDVALAAMDGLGSLTWAVPGLVLAVPGLLLVLAVMAQAVGGVLWVPVIRRRIGGFGLKHRPRP